MPALAHLGIEHPDLAWLVASAIVAFLAGLGVNVSRSNSKAESAGDAAPTDDGL